MDPMSYVNFSMYIVCTKEHDDGNAQYIGKRQVYTTQHHDQVNIHNKRGHAVMMPPSNLT